VYLFCCLNNSNSRYFSGRLFVSELVVKINNIFFSRRKTFLTYKSERRFYFYLLNFYYNFTQHFRLHLAKPWFQNYSQLTFQGFPLNPKHIYKYFLSSNFIYSLFKPTNTTSKSPPTCRFQQMDSSPTNRQVTKYINHCHTH